MPRIALMVLALAGCVAPQFDTGPAAGPARPGALAAPSEKRFLFDGWAGPALRVWYQAPDEVTATTPVVFVMHGVKRDADRYFAEWAPLAARHGFILVVPEFTHADFPGALGYNTGYFENRDGTTRPRELWSFAAIEPLFDAVKARTGTRVPAYALYGHSAGGQFVHRYVLFTPGARLSRAVAANAGWYTMPDLTVAYPYGLAGSPVESSALKLALEKPLTILLGTADTNVNDPNLRKTPEANAQGPHRHARGERFYGAGKAAAGQLCAAFGWRLEKVPGVGHENGRMAIAAASLLVE